MKKVSFFKNLQPIQYLTLGGFIFLVIAAICSIIFQEEWANITIIPYHNIVIPVTHILSAIICFCVFLFPKKEILLYCILLLETILASLTGLETIGVFLFTIFIILFYFSDFPSEKRKKTLILVFYLVFTIVLSGSIVYGKERFPIAVGCTYFFASAIYCIILTYKNKLKAILPLIQQELYISKDITLPKPGEVMHLKDYDISDRQKMILFEVMTRNKTYGEIAIKNNLSISLVKKDMTSILQYFGCKNASSLKLVLGQFVLSME